MNDSYIPRTHYLMPPEGHVYSTACGKRGYLREDAMGTYIKGEQSWLVTGDRKKVDCTMCQRRMAK